MKKRKLVVASGKGGVGKSMISSVLAMLFSKTKKIVAVDADVDAPNLHLWLGQGEDWDKIEKISTNERPIINQSKISDGQRCAQICAFGALKFIPGNNKQSGKLKVNNFFCEGCGACEAICPEAIQMEPVQNGEIRIKNNITGFPLISAQLYPGETGSGKVVDEIKKRAEAFDYQMMILDSPAGTGCPVIAALNGADYALLVTEPTPSGFSDLKRVLTVVNHFNTPFSIIINKWNINPLLSVKIEKEFQKRILGKLSYDQRIFKAIANLKPIMETNLAVKTEMKKVFNKLKKHLC